MPARKRTTGFTLIELSIVLVIIGLLVGGVLVGRDLIKAAEIRGAINNLTQIETAYNTFRVKYNCIPGDCPNVIDFLTSPTFNDGTQITNGNGNGRIEWVFEAMNSERSLYVLGLIANRAKTLDSECIWGHFSKGFFDNTCSCLMTDFVYWPWSALKNPTISWFGRNYEGAISPNVASAIDNKIDDGLPGKGRFRAANNDDVTPDCNTTISTWQPTDNGTYVHSDDLTCLTHYFIK